MVSQEVRGGTPLVVIMGPTAVGKTPVAVEVALRIGGEIVSADSMQVYRGLDAGTAKPTPRERELVPHHLVDVVDPGEQFSVAAFKRLAAEAAADIAGRGRIPLLVGGTGLYIRALVDDLPVDRVGPDWEYRRRLLHLAERRGRAHLHAVLSRLDGTAADRTHPRDLKRIIRALEMYRAGGGGPPPGGTRRASPYDALRFVLALPRDDLYGRIDRRVDAMMASGWPEEVRGLLSLGLRDWLTASKALGYSALADAVEGRVEVGAAVEDIKRQTRQLAKRQLTWFRRERDAVWLPGDPSPAPDIVRTVAGKWRIPANP